KRFAYYASINGNRSDYGLQTPLPEVLHDQSNGFGGFASLIFNPDARNQFRLVTALRRDFYQVPHEAAVNKTISKREAARDGNNDRQSSRPRRHAWLMNDSFMLAPGQRKEISFTLDQPAWMLGSISLSGAGLIVMSDEQLREYREGRCGESCDVAFFSE